MGPEWMTKQSFQEAVKPRLLMKQGIITPMSRPSQ
jgi:U3 small nucleolar RNA-associated protein 14